MQTIHFDYRSLFICSESEAEQNDLNDVRCVEPTSAQIPEILSEFAGNSNLKSLTLLTQNEQTVFDRVASCFTEINAAGGLVYNDSGEFLLIHRSGKWDLPKGKQEPGEDIRITASREVSEECGIHAPEAGDLLCITHHTYYRNGLHYLKHTYWYRMHYSRAEEPVPQTEEEIEEARWVGKDAVAALAKDTYPSIKEVLAHIDDIRIGIV